MHKKRQLKRQATHKKKYLFTKPNLSDCAVTQNQAI